MRKLSILIMIFALFITWGCEDSGQDVVNIETQLLRLIDSDETLSLDGLDDGEAVEGDYESGLDQPGNYKVLGDTLDPESGLRVRVGRMITGVDRTVEFSDTEADTIYGTVTRTVSGYYLISYLDTTLSERQVWEKPFTSDFQRKVRFIANDTPDDTTDNDYKINAVSIGIGVTGSKVDIVKLDIFDADNSVLLYSFEGDLLNQFIDRESLSTFDAWNELRVEVTVTNLGPEFDHNSGEAVMLHYGLNRISKGRRTLNDMGEDPDVTALDNVFTGYWFTHGPGLNGAMQRHRQRNFRSFVDVVDLASIFTEDEAVHSVNWAIPYTIVYNN